MPQVDSQIDLVVVLLFAGALAIGGLTTVIVAKEPEKNLFLVGVGYAFMGHLLFSLGPIPLLGTQVIGVFMAARAQYNDNARFSALMVGVVPRLLYWGWEGG